MLPFDFTLERDPKKYFQLLFLCRELYGAGLPFFIIWLTWIYTHRIFQSVILASIFMLQVYIIFFVFQDLIDRIKSHFQNSFSEERASYWLLILYVTSVLQWKWAAFTEMVLHKLVRRNYNGKLLVSIKYQHLHSFKERMIHLCQSILETRKISHLQGSTPFTVPLNCPCF